MVKSRLLIFPLLLLVSACGVDRIEAPPKLNFVLDPKDRDFAFETTTGTLCKTWEWTHNPKQPIDDIPVCFLMGHYGK